MQRDSENQRCTLAPPAAGSPVQTAPSPRTAAVSYTVWSPPLPPLPHDAAPSICSSGQPFPTLTTEGELYEEIGLRRHQTLNRAVFCCERICSHVSLSLSSQTAVLGILLCHSLQSLQKTAQLMHWPMADQMHFEKTNNLDVAQVTHSTLNGGSLVGAVQANRHST